MPKRKVKPLASGTTKSTKHNWPLLLDAWLKTPTTVSVAEFAKLHNISHKSIRDKKLEIDKQLVKPFTITYRRKHQTAVAAGKSDIGKKLAAVTTAPGKYYIRAMGQARILLEHIMSEAATGFDVMAASPYAYSSAGEAARVSIAAAESLLKICLDLQGIPADGDDYGWPMTKGFWPHSYQRDFIFDLPSVLKAQGQETFIFAFIGGIRSGKTLSAAMKFGDLCWRNRGIPAAVFGPTYRMLEDSTKPPFFKALLDKGISYKYRATDNSVTLFGDTVVKFRSMDNEEHLRGTEYGHVWIDEPGQMPDGAAFRIIMGRMSAKDVPEPGILLSMTPDGLNWLHDELILKQRENKVRLYYGSTEQNTALPEGYVDRLRSLYDERFYAQEVMGKFLDIFAGQAYWNFDRSQSISDEFDYDPGLPLILCVDFNVDPMCWNIVQNRRYRDGRTLDVCIDEMHIRTASTELACAEFLTRYGTHQAGVKIFGDATGHARNTAATRTDYKIIGDTLSAVMQGVEIKTGRSNPAVTDSISAVNARLKNTKGERNLVFHSRCKETARDFQRVGFVSGTREIDKSQKDLTHHSDAIRYYVFSEYPIRKPQVTFGGAK